MKPLKAAALTGAILAEQARAAAAPPPEPLVFVCDGRRHLVCLPYSIGNLHRMGAELGLNRNWFHRGEKPHYDLPKGRIREISAKCRVASPKDVLRIIRGELTNERELGQHKRKSV